eukprot:TRINITY_DN110973_c0_g1_i1.p1 TRINITY_DN110973_c0_g1~~TRINITY_DN110973_c0_g1_i1.p1  ORF type:complete len:386 (-),score=66.26 TRINITY_DN110973_c0_g1_i1:76-1098(-)
MARVLEALRRHPDQVGLKEQSGGSLPSRFVHIAETNRKYETFAEFGAVVFVPGDVEQMAFYEFYTMGLPIFFPADAGRFLWPKTAGPTLGPDRGCGDFGAWIGTFQIQRDDWTAKYFRFECNGQVTTLDKDRSPLASGQLVPLAVMDTVGFTHCLKEDVAHRDGVDLGRFRVRMLRGYMHVSQLFGSGSPCVAAFGHRGAPVRDELGGYSVVAVGTHTEDSPRPQLERQWDHDIFASTSWYLDARLPGRQRTKHSPFALSSVEAAKEWAQYVDFFRFPHVGLFVSFAQLQEMLAKEGTAGLQKRSRGMRAFNEETLHQSTQRWRAVLSMAVVPGNPATGS